MALERLREYTQPSVQEIPGGSGLLCNAEGCPVAVEVFEGNTNDHQTVANSEHFVGGGTWLMGWVGAAVPTGKMRC